MRKERPQLPVVKLWRLKDIGEVIRGPVPQSAPRKVSDGLLVGLLETGTVKALYRRENHILQRRTLVLGQAGEAVVFAPSGCTSTPIRICLRCPRDVVQKVANEVAGRTSAEPFFPNFITPDEQLATLFQAFQRTLDSRATLLERSSRFHDVLACIIGRHASPSQTWRNIKRERPAVRRVRQYLHENYADNFTLDELARLVGLSGFHLNRVFRMEVGLPPHAYQTQVRLTNAKLLLTKGWSIDQAAMAAGFFDQSHFTNKFRRLFGYTPGVYQKSIKNVL
jgi:AraC-like DNA-binding protein